MKMSFYFRTRTGSASTHPAKSGFTLVELLITIAILSIMSLVLGTSLMRWIPQADFKRASRTIISMYQHARIEAIKRNLQIDMICSNATNTCRSAFHDNGTSIRVFDLSELRSNVRLSKSLTTTFDSRGRAGANSIGITNDAGSSITITIRPTGSVVAQ